MKVIPTDLKTVLRLFQDEKVAHKKRGKKSNRPVKILSAAFRGGGAPTYLVIFPAKKIYFRYRYNNFRRGLLFIINIS